MRAWTSRDRSPVGEIPGEERGTGASGTHLVSVQPVLRSLLPGRGLSPNSFGLTLELNANLKADGHAWPRTTRSNPAGIARPDGAPLSIVRPPAKPGAPTNQVPPSELTKIGRYSAT